ncbi:MAG: hypothetical protein FK734_01645 [Asgard group archaeon]|nr:hypothetical protein [Asgard group archaeon]
MRLKKQKLKIILVFLMIVLLGIIGSFNLINENVKGELLDIDVRITSIQWSYSESLSNENRSAFILMTNSTVNNPNGPVELHFPNPPDQMFGTNTTIRFDNRRLDYKHICICGGIQQVEVDATLAGGTTYHSTISYLLIQKAGYIALPDGDYVFWMYMYYYKETLLNSTRALMTIENGEAIFDYNYTEIEPSIYLSISNNIILGLTTTSLMVIIAFERKTSARKNH